MIRLTFNLFQVIVVVKQKKKGRVFMKKAICIFTVLVMVSIMGFAFSEGNADKLTLMFQKSVNHALYSLQAFDDVDLDQVTVDKITIYTLPDGYSGSCTYYFAQRNKYITEDDITDDKPFICIDLSTENKYGVKSTITAVFYFRGGFERVNEQLDSDNPGIQLNLTSSFCGGLGGWSTSLFTDMLAQAYPLTASDLDTEYLMKTYTPPLYVKK